MVASFVVIMFGFLLWRTLRKRSSTLDCSNKGKPAAIEPAPIDELLGKKFKKEPISINIASFEQDLLRLTLVDIMKSTEKFNKAHIIKDGGFGTVYKAVLPAGLLVSIKRLMMEQVTGRSRVLTRDGDHW